MCNPQFAQGSPVLQSASIRNPPSEKRNIASGGRTWNCAGPGTTSNWVPKLPTDAFCVISRAEPESAYERGAWGVRSRDFAQSQVTIRNPPICSLCAILGCFRARAK
eukprot:7637029-Alexandrium_andersonii.AAC.1